ATRDTESRMISNWRRPAAIKRSPFARPNSSRTPLGFPERRSTTPRRVARHELPPRVLTSRRDSYDRNGPNTSRMAHSAPARLVGRERFFVGMRARVRQRHARHDGVGEDERAVAREQVASKEELADEQRVVVRAIVVGAVDLVPFAAVAREHERLAANFGTPL